MSEISHIVEIGWVRTARIDPIDDGWDAIPARIDLDPARFTPDSLSGIGDFSHVEVLYRFHRATEPTQMQARHPRGRQDWPKVGIFAQRAKARPNLIGATICTLTKVAGLSLYVRGLDAIDGTPVLDIKPVMREFLPREPVRQPDWASQLMENYWHPPQ